MTEYLYSSIKKKHPQTLTSFKTGCWVIVTNPTKEELEKLAKERNLDKNILFDALDPYEVPHVEREDGNVYVFTRIPTTQPKVVTHQILFIVAESCFVIISPKPLQLPNQVLTKKEVFTTQRVRSLIACLSQNVYEFQHNLLQVSKKISYLSTNLDEIGNKEIIQFIFYEQVLNEQLNAAVDLDTVLQTILSGKVMRASEHDLELIEDVKLAVAQLIVLSKSRLVAIQNTRDAHMTLMTNTLNRIVKLFTSLTVVLTIPTIISSFFGMNVNLPGQHGGWAFWIIVGVTVLIVGIILFVFEKKRWL